MKHLVGAIGLAFSTFLMILFLIAYKESPQYNSGFAFKWFCGTFFLFVLTVGVALQ